MFGIYTFKIINHLKLIKNEKYFSWLKKIYGSFKMKGFFGKLLTYIDFKDPFDFGIKYMGGV